MKAAPVVGEQLKAVQQAFDARQAMKEANHQLAGGTSVMYTNAVQGAQTYSAAALACR